MRDLKALLFSVGMTLFVLIVGLQWYITGSFWQAILLFVQIVMLLVVVSGLFVVFLLLGLRIFHKDI
jgi:hypothetical protein